MSTPSLLLETLHYAFPFYEIYIHPPEYSTLLAKNISGYELTVQSQNPAHPRSDIDPPPVVFVSSFVCTYNRYTRIRKAENRTSWHVPSLLIWGALPIRATISSGMYSMSGSLLSPSPLASLTSCGIPAFSENSSMPYYDDDLDPSCWAVSDDMDRIDEMNLDWFVNCILPSPVDELVINDVLDNLGQVWTVAYNEESRKQNEDEFVVFSLLERIFDSLVNAVNRICPARAQITELKFLDRLPHFICTDFTLPDVVFELVNKDSSDRQSYWRDIAASVDMKDDDNAESFEHNFRKVMSNFHHIFQNDDRRQCAIGITIENTTTRLWWACRAKVIVTEPFDFVETLKPLIQALATLGFSACTELGYDLENESTKHTSLNLVDFEDGKFLIQKGLSKLGADCLRKHVLKDVFIEDIELAKLTKGRKNLRFSPLSHRYSTIIHSEWERLGRCFPWLSPLSDVFSDDIFPSNEESQDSEPNVRGFETGLDVPSTPGSIIVPSIALAKHVRALTREHYRIILRQTECRASHTPKFTDIIQILQTAVEVLRFAHTADWASSDVGFVTVVSYPRFERTSDMAFAKKLDSITHGEFATGMLNFMSIEVQQLQYEFRPEGPPNSSLAEMDIDDPTAEEKVTRIRQKKVIAFRYNPIHDFESIWWIAVWSFFHRDFDPAPPDGYDRNFERREYGRILFPGEFAFDFGERYKAFKSDERFRLICATLPFCLQRAGVVLDELRKALVAAYTSAERNLPDGGSVDLSVCDELWKTFMHGFEKMGRLTEGVSLIIRQHGIGQWKEWA